jgi:hypothetical protein
MNTSEVLHLLPPIFYHKSGSHIAQHAFTAAKLLSLLAGLRRCEQEEGENSVNGFQM